jgi:hypothetical protein
VLPSDELTVLDRRHAGRVAPGHHEGTCALRRHPRRGERQADHLAAGDAPITSSDDHADAGPSTEEGRERMSRRDVVITVMGEMSDALRAEFDDLRIVSEHGVTRIHVAAADPPALHGVLHRLEVLGLELLDVHLGCDPPQP